MAEKEYIEREALLENLHKFAPEHNTPLIQLLVTRQPTADVAEVVRCKDCKHLDIDEGYSNGRFCSVHSLGVFCEDNDFCSYGERKTND